MMINRFPWTLVGSLVASIAVLTMPTWAQEKATAPAKPAVATSPAQTKSTTTTKPAASATVTQAKSTTTKPDSKPATKAETTSTIKAESKSESQTKSPTKSTTKTTAKPESVTKSKSETKSETKSESKSAGKSNGKSTDKDALTAEQSKKFKAMLKQTLKSFAAAELTTQQQQQADEVFAKAVKDFVVKRSTAMITDDLQKKQAAGLKEAIASGKSQREQTVAAFASAGFTEDQIKVFKSTQTALNKAKRDFGKTLSEKQIASLPETLQKTIKGGKS